MQLSTAYLIRTQLRYLSSPFTFLLVVILIVAASGCSTTKDGFLNRAYHNTTSRYNGYYYSRESIKEGLAITTAEHKDDYEEILPIYIIPTNEEEAGKVVTQMERAITKSTTVIKHHSMKISNKERCKWIDDNYMAVARANYYKRAFPEAERIFEFVAKEYKTLPTRYDAQFWLARTYIEENKLEEAGLLLSALSQDKELPIKKKGEFHKAYTLYYIARENYASAADNMMKAIPFEKKKKNKNRLTYILAQLYQRAGNDKEAVRSFVTVANKSNDYEMVFNSRIIQATSASTKFEVYQIKNDLLKMLKDDKNIEFQDQIYFALGEVSLKARSYKDALMYWQKSAEVSTTNVKQKSRSFLRLAEYHFDQKQYQSAQVFYDSAVAVLPPKFPEADEIKQISANLNELVKELNTINEQDSLLALAKLSPQELDKRLDQIRKQLQKKADDEAAAKEVAQATAATTIPKAAPSTATASAGSFYMYNENARKLGYSDFKKKWGTRKLEDNWRRKNKISADGGTGGFADDPSADTSATAKTTSSVIIKKDDLKKDIPISIADNIAANNQIIEALYAAGNIYKEKFKDNENSIASFTNLVQRYDTSRYEAIAYYQLYRLYLQKESKKEGGYFSLDPKSSSAYYRDLILLEYPQSEFARLVQNPEYLKEAQANVKTDMADYFRVFQLYKQASYTDALLASDSLIAERPASPIAAKFYFLKSSIQAELHNVDGMIGVLTAITVKFPKTPEAVEAQRILDVLKVKMPAGVLDSTTKALPVDTTANKALVSDYKINEAAEHYFILIFPNDGLDPNAYKAAMMNYNSANYSTLKLDLTNTFLDNDNQLIIMKSFPNKTEAMNYYKAFIADKKLLRLINIKPENKSFIITVENFISLFKLKKTEDYLKFFTENYPK